MAIGLPGLRFTAPWLLVLLTACGGGDGGGVGPPPKAASAPPPAGTVGDGRLGELLEWARASQDVPAMGAVVIRRGSIAEVAVVGRRSARGTTPVTAGDRWHLGSITKSMTATLAATLVEDGMIGWDTTAAEVWPEAASQMHAGYRDATLRQFLSHTSGLRRDDDWGGAGDGGSQGVVDKRRAWALRLLAAAPDTTVGQFSYSNIGYVVAGAMLETRAGAAWETLLASRVFAPLGMAHSGFGAPGTRNLEDQPLGHWSRSLGYDPVQPGDSDADVRETYGPGGRVHVTLEDFALYLQAHLSGAQGQPGLLSVDSFATLHSEVAPGYALGWSTPGALSPLQSSGFFHNGSTLRWFAITWFSPSADAGVLLVTNAGGDRPFAALGALDGTLRARVQASP
jgi:CubicO group peptidase (beta-lactamase class C family)